uniref:Uncharacterized protein n=1 Tax=Arundo donax TaxID=35708 RepID=A0A0A9FKZ7_ARUDO
MSVGNCVSCIFACLWSWILITVWNALSLAFDLSREMM